MGWLPVQKVELPVFDPATGIWTVKGTFYQYNNEQIKIKIGFSAQWILFIEQVACF